MSKKLTTTQFKLYQKLIIVFVAALLTCHVSYGRVIHHHKKIKHHQNINLGKIILTPQPNNPLTSIAYRLNKTDIDFAIKHGEKPLILIGSTNLSSLKKSQEVLFTQLQSASLCGSGGCTTTAYLKHNSQWIKILDSVTGDIEVKKTSHKGMHDLLVEGSDLWIWNKKTYVETQQGPNLNGFKNSIQSYQKAKNN